MAGSWGREATPLCTLATAPKADMMRQVLRTLTTLQTRIEAGGCTFLVKVKSHRGEPINEQADDLAEERGFYYS